MSQASVAKNMPGLTDPCVPLNYALICHRCQYRPLLYAPIDLFRGQFGAVPMHWLGSVQLTTVQQV